MTEKERIQEWVRFYKQSHLTYKMNALLAVVENDGPDMLESVLKELSLLRSKDLVLDAAERVKLDKRRTN